MVGGMAVVNPKLPVEFSPGSTASIPAVASGLPAPLNTKLSATSQLFMPTINMQDVVKVNSSGSALTLTKPDTSRHYHVFVGDLSPDLETHHLRDAFIAFGQISECKIIRDPQSLKSKGYGFVSFIRKEEAENAISAMNGQWIGCRPIRTNWASRKPLAPNQKEVSQKPLVYEEVYNQTSTTNCTVYCGGVLNGLTEELIDKTFSPYGTIMEIRAFKEKGYAFIRFGNKETAAEAIVGVHGMEVNGQIVKCAWGKEPNESIVSLAGSPTYAILTPQQSFPCSPTVGQQIFGYNNYPTNFTPAPVTPYIQPCVPSSNGFGTYPCCVPLQWTAHAQNTINQNHLVNNQQSSANTQFLGYQSQTNFQPA